MHGLHLCADLRGCDPRAAWMVDVQALRALCLPAVQAAGLSPVAECFHAFVPDVPDQPAGVTGVVLLAESHLAVHTWPERGEVTLDVYVCNRGQDNAGKAHGLLDRLLAAMAPREHWVQAVQRGATIGSNF
jgi:S-adenosylmethionine decarboxylase proenzyme